MPKKIKEEKQISVNKFEKFISPIVPFPIALDEETILVKPRLNFTEAIGFINSVVQGCIDEFDDSVSYAVQDFITRVAFFETYTNVRLPENHEKKYEFVYGVDMGEDGDLYERIINSVGFRKDLYDTHLLAIKNQMEFEISKMQNQFKTETQAFVAKIESEAEQIMKIINVFTDVFKDIEPTKMAKILEKIPEMENMTEKNLAEAILEVQKEGEENV